MEIFGSLERFLSEDVYPYRVPVTLALLAIVAGVLWLAWKRGWLAQVRAFALRRPTVTAVLAILVLAVVVPTGYGLVSPLWTRTTLVEESPLAAATAPPAGAETAALTATQAPGTVSDLYDSEYDTPSGVASTSEPADDADFPQTVLSGEWMGADDFHFARGQALVIETAPDTYVLRVEDFSVRNGPDLYVYLSPDPGGYTDDAIELGTLKATDGAFNYEIPAGISLEEVRSAVVWCKDFAVLFGTAALQ